MAKDSKSQFEQEFIRRVRLARQSTGLKQWQVADALDEKQDHYKHWETSRLMPHHHIPNFCTICHVNPGWLITGHGKMKLETTESSMVAPIAKRARSIKTPRSVA